MTPRATHRPPKSFSTIHPHAAGLDIGRPIIWPPSIQPTTRRPFGPSARSAATCISWPTGCRQVPDAAGGAFPDAAAESEERSHPHDAVVTTTRATQI